MDVRRSGARAAVALARRLALAAALAPAACGSGFHKAPPTPDLAMNPVQLIAGQRAASQDLAVGGGFVYWVDQGTFANAAKDGQLLRAPVTGCADAACPQVLADNQVSPGGVALARDGSAVFWCELSDGLMTPKSGKIWSLPLDGNPKILFAPDQDGPRKLAIDDMDLYWIDGNSGEVWRGDLGRVVGAAAIVTGEPSPVEIEVDAPHDLVYWTDFGTDGTDGKLMRAARDGTNPLAVARDQNQPRGLAVGSTYVYWADAGSGTIVRASPDGHDVTVLLSDRLTPNDVALDGQWLYFAEGGSDAANFTDGRIVAMRLSDGELRVLADARHYPRSLALDDAFVYWVDRGDRTTDAFDAAVARVPKPE